MNFCPEYDYTLTNNIIKFTCSLLITHDIFGLCIVDCTNCSPAVPSVASSPLYTTTHACYPARILSSAVIYIACSYYHSLFFSYKYGLKMHSSGHLDG
jgi:hypothetical protein